AAETIKDAKIPEMLKLHTFAINHIAQWAKKNGKRNLNKGSAEFQKAYVEAFFAAAEVLSAKEDIFKIDKKGILRNTNARFDLDRLVEKMLQEE
ncbi:MAG: hypothetical protein DME18_06805, partial [Verrucomicrobia bacterium]